MHNTPPDKVENAPAYPWVTAAFGLFFTGLAIAIPFLAGLTIGPIVVSLVLAVLGIDALVSAYLKKESFLSRIGPLP